MALGVHLVHAGHGVHVGHAGHAVFFVSDRTRAASEVRAGKTGVPGKGHAAGGGKTQAAAQMHPVEAVQKRRVCHVAQSQSWAAAESVQLRVKMEVAQGSRYLSLNQPWF